VKDKSGESSKPWKEVPESNSNLQDLIAETGLQLLLKMSKFSPENRLEEDSTLLFLMAEPIK